MFMITCKSGIFPTRSINKFRQFWKIVKVLIEKRENKKNAKMNNV